MKTDGITEEYMLPDIASTFQVFAAHWRSVSGGWSYPEHSNPLFEVNLVLQGSQIFRLNGRDYVQQAGDIIIVKPGEVHESREGDYRKMTYYCLHFDVEDRMLREQLGRNKESFHAADSPLAKLIMPALDKLIGMTTGTAGFNVSRRMMAMSAVFELFAGLSERIASPEKGGPHDAAAAQIAGAFAVKLEQHLEAGNRPDTSPGNEKDIVKQISLQLGYSTSSCGRIFQQVYGLSPRQYLSSLVLKKAKLMLMEMDKPIEWISGQLGYGSIAHFSRQFKRWTGESPKQYRNRFL